MHQSSNLSPSQPITAVKQLVLNKYATVGLVDNDSDSADMSVTPVPGSTDSHDDSASDSMDEEERAEIQKLKTEQSIRMAHQLEVEAIQQAMNDGSGDDIPFEDVGTSPTGMYRAESDHKWNALQLKQQKQEMQEALAHQIAYNNTPKSKVISGVPSKVPSKVSSKVSSNRGTPSSGPQNALLSTPLHHHAFQSSHNTSNLVADLMGYMDTGRIVIPDESDSIENVASRVSSARVSSLHEAVVMDPQVDAKAMLRKTYQTHNYIDVDGDDEHTDGHTDDDDDSDSQSLESEDKARIAMHQKEKAMEQALEALNPRTIVKYQSDFSDGNGIDELPSPSAQQMELRISQQFSSEELKIQKEEMLNQMHSLLAEASKSMSPHAASTTTSPRTTFNSTAF